MSWRLQEHRNRDSASRGASVYLLNFTGTKLYSMGQKTSHVQEFVRSGIWWHRKAFYRIKFSLSDVTIIWLAIWTSSRYFWPTLYCFVIQKMHTYL